METEIQAANNEALKRIQLAHKTGAVKLSLTELAMKRLPNELGVLTALQNLDVNFCRELRDLQALSELTALQDLSLIGCEQLQDLQPLVQLTALQNLNLRGCEELQDLHPLAELMALRNLDLRGCKQLHDLQPLAKLTALQTLNLNWCMQLQNLQPLAKLTALQNLDVSYWTDLPNLQPLARLTALQTLNLSWCVELQNFQPLAKLTALQTLKLSTCRQLRDLQPVAQLTTLQSLDLSNCDQLQDLQPLAKLTALQSLNLSRCWQIQDLQPLAKLTALQNLDLSYCKQLQELQPLAQLTALQKLDLSWCSQLQDLEPLANLSELTGINLLEGSWLDCSLDAQPLASWRELDELYANRLIAAPTELGSKNSYSDNALPRLHGWQQDLAASEAPNSTVKLFVLGNGGVGKTQICRRLCGEDFDPSIPSTHGIRLGQLQLAGASENLPAVDANFWDFGGQDIYLGTHALFLDERALYVIAWTPQHENSTESEQDDALERNRPLIYWLEYVRSLAGPQVPVIIVQTQCDRELDVRSAPLPAEHGFDRLRITSSSAKQDDGMERLTLELKSAARYQLERYGKVCLPARWVAVGEELRARIHEKTLPRAEFDALCSAKHGSAVPEVVLEYLHRSGQVFWREGLFDNRVVLDLAWALDGVYAVFERNTALPEIRRQAGRFSPQLLGALVWQEYPGAECDLFLSLMEQCQICFKVAEDVFIAPDLLSEQAAVESDIQAVWREATADAMVRLDYAFLHDGVLRAMLCGIGQKASAHAVYWAYGVCFYDAKTKSTVRISSDLPNVAAGQMAGSLTLEAAGPDAASLVNHLVESIQQINMGRPPGVTWQKGKAGRDPCAEAEATGPTEQAFDAVHPATPPRLEGEAQPVYVSYAWGGESEELVDKFEQRLPGNFKLIRDKSAMRPGDWISRFMADIGQADLVLVVLSQKYLFSYYCMYELLYLLKNSGDERERLMQRIVLLVVGDFNIARVRDRDAYVTYWEKEYEDVHEILNKRQLGSVGEADRKELLAIEDFHNRISDMLAWVADTLMPQGVELHTEGIDAAIDLLKQRAIDLGGSVD